MTLTLYLGYIHLKLEPFLVLLLIISVLIPNAEKNGLAESPSFVRQEIGDNVHDVNEINYCEATITSINDTNVHDTISDSIDIQRVSYFSDGNVLNATIWLLIGFNGDILSKVVGINFGSLIDVNPNPNLGIGGVGYHKEVQWPAPPDLPGTIILNSSETWIEDIHEALSYGPHRYIQISEKNYTELLAKQTNRDGSFDRNTHYLPLSLELNTMSLPDKYKVMFYVGVFLYDKDCNDLRLADFTNWIDIPPQNSR